jgi:hypothetical protein
MISYLSWISIYIYKVMMIPITPDARKDALLLDMPAET